MLVRLHGYLDSPILYSRADSDHSVAVLVFSGRFGGRFGILGLIRYSYAPLFFYDIFLRNGLLYELSVVKVYNSQPIFY